MKTIELKFEADKLRKKRRELEISQEELGKTVGVTRACIANWEKGETQPSLDHVGKLGAALGVPAGYFLKGV